MQSITRYMRDNHRHCDALCAEAEAAISNKDRKAGLAHFAAFTAELERHLRMEEEVLFPEFEQRTGMAAGPTHVMRAEHRQIRQLVEEARQSLDTEDDEGVLDTLDTLLALLQQHNAKEEQVLYPMADRTFGEELTQILARIQGSGN